MGKTLATWYMETAWLKMGWLRNLKPLHKLFNVAYSIRKQEYLDQIMAMPVAMSDYQEQRRSDISYLLQLQGVI